MPQMDIQTSNCHKLFINSSLWSQNLPSHPNREREASWIYDKFDRSWI